MDVNATTLLRLSGHDPWTVADSFEGTQIFGATGSGKTSGSGRAIATAFLRAGFGGLVLTAKPDEAELWRRYCEESGRSDSLLVVSPQTEHRFNFLDYEARRPGVGSGLTENLVSLFCTVLEASEKGSGSIGGQDPYWERALRQLLRNGIDAIRLADRPLTLPDLARFVRSAPMSEKQRDDPAWRERSFCHQCLQTAHHRALSPSDRADLELTFDHWMGEFLSLAENTRSSVVSTFTSMADGFLRGTMREMFCTETTFVPELTHEGAVIVVDLPVKQYHDLGRYAQVLIKYLWQRATERRDTTVSSRPVFLWIDEAQHFVTGHDMEFQATARSSRAATVLLTQNISNYLQVLSGKGDNAQAVTDSLLGNLQTKIFHANGDAKTNECAESLFAKTWRWRTSASTSEREQKDPRRNGSNSSTASVSQSLDSEVLAQSFHTLRKGGPRDSFVVDAILFQAGRVWNASGKTSLKVSFQQT